MEIEFLGGNCLKISTKKAILIVDDNLVELGLKTVTKEDYISLFTKINSKPPITSKLLIDIPGEYEVSDVSIIGVSARTYGEDSKFNNSVMYKITSGDIRLLVTGNIYPELSEKHIESIGTIDIVAVPVGNNQITLSGEDALRIIKKLEPKLIIPTFYADKKIKFESQPQSLENAISQLAMESNTSLPKLKLKSTDLIDNTRLIVLDRQ